MEVISLYKSSGWQVIPAARGAATHTALASAGMTVPLRHFNRPCGPGGLSFAVRLG
jgi:methyl coenzyme M reductase alpha subunit